MAVKHVRGKYQVTIRDANRKEHQRTFRLKSEADIWFHASKQDVQRGSFIRAVKDTITDLSKSWIDGKKAEGGCRYGTLSNYDIHINNYIVPVLGAVRVQSLTIKDCEDAAKKWMEMCSANTANMVLKTLTGILDQALRHRLVEINVAEKAMRLKIATEEEDDGEVQPEDIYSQDELAALIEATDPGTLERILIWLGAFCGLRIGEILGASWPAIDLSNKTKVPKLRVIKNLVPEQKETVRNGKQLFADFPGYGNTGRTLRDPKKKSRRSLPAPRGLLQDLRLWKLKCPAARPLEWDGTDPLSKQLIMVTVDGKPLQKKAAQNMLDQVSARAGVTRRTLHRLRHTFASQLLADGTSLKDVSHYLGHKDVSITSRVYAHFVETESDAVQNYADRVLARAKKKQ